MSLEDDFWWICNVDDITAMPKAVRIDLTGNIGLTHKDQSSAETFRDLCAVVEEMAAADTEIAQPRLGRVPSIEEYLQSCRVGTKTRRVPFA